MAAMAAVVAAAANANGRHSSGRPQPPLPTINYGESSALVSLFAFAGGQRERRPESRRVGAKIAAKL